MDDLINRQKNIDVDVLKEWIENWFTKNRYYHPYAKNNSIPITELYDILERLPSVEAEPIVRCKDCEFYTAEERWCSRLGLVGAFDQNDYCSHAERRKDETD